MTTVTPADPGEVTSTAPRGLPRWGALGFLPLLAGLVLAIVGATSGDPAEIGNYGIITAAAPVYFVGLALIIVGFFLWLGTGARGAYLIGAAHVAALVVALHGLPGMLEPNPRFPVAWLHVGFADQIARNGELLGRLDARFSWAGFFSGSALVQRAGDTESLLWVVRFTPIAINLFACWAIALIARPFGIGRRGQLLAMLGFVLLNWTGQDYFSPQGVNFSLYLVIVAALVTLFAHRVGPFTTRVHEWLRAAPVATINLPTRSRIAAYLGVVLIATASVLSHQLTPVFLASSLLLLLAVGVLRPRALPFLVLTLFGTWLAFGATKYWAGHLDNILRGPDLQAGVNANVGRRASGGQLSRQLVVYSRIGLAAAGWFGALGCAWLARRRGSWPVALLCLVLAPIPAFVVQPYGGEMLIRVYLFGLPFIALLLARQIDGAGNWNTARRAVTGLACLALVPVFLLARFGNERFEQVTNDDAAVVRALYVDAVPGSIVYIRNRQTIQFSRQVRDVRFRELGDKTVEEMMKVIKGPNRGGNVYVMLSESQAAYGELISKREPGWLDDLRQELLATGSFDVLASAGDSYLLELKEDA